jgi:RimJ/RimL family protein N-acetyltransferase
VRIETPRLVLRRWRAVDVDALAELFESPQIVRWLGPLGREDAAATVERYEHHWATLGFGRFAVEEKATGRLVGRVGVMRQPDWIATPETDEVGWLIAADRWSDGLATEAAAAAVEDAFDRVGLQRVISFTLPENTASRRVMEKCGLRHRGVADWKGREHVWYDVLRGAISAPDELPGTGTYGASPHGDPPDQQGVWKWSQNESPMTVKSSLL